MKRTSRDSIPDLSQSSSSSPPFVSSRIPLSKQIHTGKVRRTSLRDKYCSYILGDESPRIPSELLYQRKKEQELKSFTLSTSRDLSQSPLRRKTMDEVIISSFSPPESYKSHDDKVEIL
jgi:hypothetical protein